MHIGVQIDMRPSQVNTSKLYLAHEFLKQLNISSQQLCSRCEDQSINTAITATLISLENNGDGGDTVENIQQVSKIRSVAANQSG